jgi:tetratricopeptide (TPR) repeat protein
MKYLDEQKNQEALEQFLKAQVPDEEAGSAQFGNRNMQVHYFIARAYEALGEEQKATAHDRLASEVDGTERTAIMSYYQGLSYQKRNDQKRARTIFEKMVAKGEQQLHPGEEKQERFFSIFGEREAENIRKSMTYTLRGLGYKGLGDKAKAKDDLARAVELSQGNLWARTELAQITE